MVWNKKRPFLKITSRSNWNLLKSVQTYFSFYFIPFSSQFHEIVICIKLSQLSVITLKKCKQLVHNLWVLSKSLSSQMNVQHKFILTLTFQCVFLSPKNSLFPRPSGHRGGSMESKSSQSFQSDSRCVINKWFFL